MVVQVSGNIWIDVLDDQILIHRLVCKHSLVILKAIVLIVEQYFAVKDVYRTWWCLI
jgi:hypothetical protein